MSSATTLSTPQNEVDALIKQVADENGLEVMDKMAEAPLPGTSIGAASSTTTRSKGEEDALTSRLAALRN
jgi:charged multivesicular body protein 1